MPPINTLTNWLASGFANTSLAGTAEDATVTLLENGNYLVTWSTDSTSGVASPSGTDIVGQIFDPYGSKVGSEFLINQNHFGQFESNASVTQLVGGGFMVVYEQSIFDIVSLRMDVFDDAGVLQSTVDTIEYDTASAYSNYSNVKVAASSTTSVLIVYEVETAAGDIDLLYRIYNPSTNTLGASANFVTGGTTSAITNVDITVLTNGYYVAAMNFENTTDDAVVIQLMSSAGSLYGSAFLAGDTYANSNNDNEASVTALSGGGFVVAWTGHDGNDVDVNFEIFNSSGSAIVPQGKIEDDSTDTANTGASVVGLLSGGFLIVYKDGETSSIKAVRYANDGTTDGNIITVSGLNGQNIDATMLDDGRVSITFDYAGNIQTAIVDPRIFISVTGAGDDGYIVGTTGDDNLYMNSVEFNSVNGWDGDDYITLGTGVFNANMVFDGGEGKDTLDLSLLSSGIFMDMEFDIIDDIGGGTASNVRNMEKVRATDHVDLFYGSKGKDTLYGNDGNDTLIGRVGKDKLYGDKGADILAGGGGNDRLKGGKGNDALDGGKGNDELVGGNGRDTLDGGRGDDLLTGGDGVDKFIFSANRGEDTISDFEDDVDKLDFSGFEFANKGDAKSHLFEAGTDSDDHVMFSYDGTTIHIYGLDLLDITNSDIII